MKKHFPFLLFIAVVSNCTAATWLVGPTQTYTMPSQVSTLVQDGDTVAIDAGVYNSDVARWTANNLVLKGVGGLAHLKANGNSYGGKAIWVISGNNTTVEWIEFSLCACPSNNGAGIRQEGIDLTVRYSYFHDNENGILAGDNVTSNMLIEYCEFYNNGYGDGFTHNLYINHLNSLTFRYNYSHHAIVGHELKSRAHTNYILYNRLCNESTGDASREIDLPNGGTAIVIGNEIEQGPMSQNSNIVGHGLEGLSNPTAHEFYFINNTVVNDRPNGGTFVSVQAGTALYKAYNNIFAGPGTILSGSANTIDTSSNWYVSIANAGFVNAGGYDYHLVSSSGAINNGTNPGFANTYSLTPVLEYLHPANNAARAVNGPLDKGAHEFGAFTSSAGPVSTDELIVYPNPSSGTFFIRMPAEVQDVYASIYDLYGNLIMTSQVFTGTLFLQPHLPRGTYLLRITRENGSVCKKLIVH
jgi:hypothetical protein